MPRKSRKKTEPAAVADTLETLKESIPGLKSASEAYRQLEPAQPELEPLPKAKRTPDESGIDRKLVAEFLEDIKQGPGYANLASKPHEPAAVPVVAPKQPEPTESEQPGSHAAAVLARRPNMQPTPPGFFGVASDRQAGIRVSKSSDHGSVAIQFAQDRLPTRGEKDILERVGQPEDGQNFVYRASRKQWERQRPENWAPSENTLDAVRVMQELASARNEGRGR